MFFESQQFGRTKNEVANQDIRDRFSRGWLSTFVDAHLFYPRHGRRRGSIVEYLGADDFSMHSLPFQCLSTLASNYFPLRANGPTRVLYLP